MLWRLKEMVGRHHEFEMALQKLRGSNANIAREADEIKVHFEPKTWLENRSGTWRCIYETFYN